MCQGDFCCELSKKGAKSSPPPSYDELLRQVSDLRRYIADLTQKFQDLSEKYDQLELRVNRNILSVLSQLDGIGSMAAEERHDKD